MLNALGALLLFVSISVFVGISIVSMGWRDALFMWGFSVAMTAAIVVGVYLLLTPAHAEPVEIISADKLIALGKQRLAEQKAPVVGFPIPLPPERFSKPYTGHLNIVKAEDYSVLRSLCSSTTAVACSVRSATSCLIMLGPMVHDNIVALQHEMGHCQGWSAKHEDAR